MKEYPTIKNPPNIDDYFYVFDKLDGNNIMCEISRKKGCHKFGSRKVLIDDTHSFLGEAPDLIRNKYEKDICDILKKQQIQEAICYFEFFGPSSAFGRHEKEPHDVVLFDVFVPKQGIIEPKDFIKIFGNLHIPNLVYQGKLNKIIIEQIRKKELEGITSEGVIAKGQQDRKTQIPYMFKIKTYEWLEKLKKYCNGDQIKFEGLE